MSEQIKTVVVRARSTARAREQVLVTHKFHHQFRASGFVADEGTAVVVARLNGDSIDPKKFPWPTAEAGSALGLMLVNTTDEVQTLGVKITGKEVR